MYGKKVAGIVLAVSVLVCLSVSSARAQQRQGLLPPWLGDAIERPLSKYFFNPLESRLGNFSLGDYTIEPIEERIPGLDLSGWLRNRTWRYLHGPTGDAGVLGAEEKLAQLGARAPFRSIRKNQFNMIEWLAELEAHYRVNPDLELVSILNYRYDSVFDWDKNWRYTRNRREKGFVDDVETELAYYHRTKDILRELYLNYTITTKENGSWNFRIGKQQVGLGKQDFNVIDVINQQFNTAGIFSAPANLEWDRIPVWMWNMSYIFPERLIPNLSLKFLWIPDFEPDRSNFLNGGAAFALGAPPTRTLRGVAYDGAPLANWEAKRKHEDWSIGGSEWAVNLNYILKGWDIGLWYLSDWQPTPVTFRRGTAPSEREHTRQENFMWGVDKNFYLAKRYWALKI